METHMARGIRKHTIEMVEIVREQKPLAIGPLLGQLAMQFNISAGMMSELLKVHEQTILRWYMGYSNPPAAIHRKMGPILAFFLWAVQAQIEPFKGDAKERKALFARLLQNFLKAS
jgi:hypothetical protein